MAKSCCGGNGAAILAAKAAYANTPRPVNPLSVRVTTRGRAAAPVLERASGPFDPVRMEFTGQRSGAVTYQGAPGSGRQYRGGNNATHRYINAHPDDVTALERTGMWRRVGVVLLSEPKTETVKVETPAPANGAKAPEPVIVTEPVAEPEPVPVAADMSAEMPAANDTYNRGAPYEAPAGAVQTADGVVRRKRRVVKGKSTPLKDV
jgi:hypothetical protein